MRAKLETILYMTFPDLYRDRVLPPMQSSMCYGFECTDNWFDILYELSERIDGIARKYNLEGEDYPRAIQVKNKMGSLRFYFECPQQEARDEIHKVIDVACLKAYKRINQQEQYKKE